MSINGVSLRQRWTTTSSPLVWNRQHRRPRHSANIPLTVDHRSPGTRSLKLIPTYITPRSELNEAEQENFAEADLWAFARKRGDVVDADVLMSRHRRMLRRVWKWAGTQRTSELNIGVAPHQIAVDLHALIGDVRFWIENSTFPADEIAVRFHHRLVAIHPFPNGNGRHSRLAADCDS
jgi:Fic-DOC domain mobile mystery protein B